MVYIGNDIINLKDAYSLNKENDINWIDKVFTNKEKQYIFESKLPKLSIWKLWSCKESAYKVILKKEKKRFLNPRRIEILPKETSENYLIAKYGNHTFLTYSIHTKEYIHTICSNNNSFNHITKEIFYYPNISQSDGSKMMRSAMIQKITSIYGECNFSFHKDEIGIPIINASLLKGTIDISFSHDEPHFAYIYIKNA